jgi:hypothetical protein
MKNFKKYISLAFFTLVILGTIYTVISEFCKENYSASAGWFYALIWMSIIFVVDVKESFAKQKETVRYFVVFYIATGDNNSQITGEMNFSCSGVNPFLVRTIIVEKIINSVKEKNVEGAREVKSVVITNFIELTEKEYKVWIK